MKNMKNIKYILIFVLCFFCLNFDVLAISKNNWDSYLKSDSSSDIIINQSSDTVCVYKLDNENIKNYKHVQYLIVVFGYNSNYDDGSKKAYTIDTSYMFGKDKLDSYIYDNETNKNFIYDFKGCSNYKMALTANHDGTLYGFNIYSGNISEKDLEYVIYDMPNNDYYTYSYSGDLTTELYSNKIKYNSNEASTKECTYTVGKTKYVINSLNEKNITYTVNGKVICPATSTDGHLYKKYDSSENFLKDFVCSEWELRASNYYIDSDSDGYGDGIDSCDYYLVSSKTPNIGYQTITEVETTNIKTVTQYTAYNSDDAPYIKVVLDSENNYKYYYNRNKKVKDEDTLTTITNSTDAIANAFSKEDEANYPKYIVCTDVYKNCRFSSEKGDGTKAGGETTYININYIGSIVGLGEKSVIETCEELIGDTFIDFLKNNIFKVLYIIIPIILIVLTTFDFAKAVFSENKDGLQKAFKMFIRRVIASILILLVPTILIFVTNIFGNSDVKKCVEIFQNSATSS